MKKITKRVLIIVALLTAIAFFGALSNMNKYYTPVIVPFPVTNTEKTIIREPGKTEYIYAKPTEVKKPAAQPTQPTYVAPDNQQSVEVDQPRVDSAPAITYPTGNIWGAGPE